MLKPYALPRNDAIECITLGRSPQAQLGAKQPSDTAAFKLIALEGHCFNASGWHFRARHSE